MKYAANTDLTFEIPLVDAAGSSIDASSVRYKVLDQDGVMLVDWTTLAGYATGTDATITVLAANNALPVGRQTAAREILIECTTATGLAAVTFAYVIEAITGALVRGVNTLVTIAGAELLAADMSGLTSWTTVSNAQKTVALMEAFRRLANMTLTQTEPGYGIGKIRLSDLSVAEVLSIESKMLGALQMAQVAEADAILGGDEDKVKESGVILDTIGEVKKMYRSTKPITTPVSKKALNYIGKYTNLHVRLLGRG